MSPVVFTEKIRRPDARGLVRDRLQRRLLDADGPSLGLVLGPPGSGKTTLLSRVAAVGEQSAWYRASPEDDDEPALVRHLTHALSVALADPRLGVAAEAGSVGALVVPWRASRVCRGRRPLPGSWWTTCMRSPVAGRSMRWSGSCCSAHEAYASSSAAGDHPP